MRELLIAGRRRAHEIWISAELEGDDGVADIVELAGAERVPVAYVAKGRLEREARSEAPQGVLAFAAELPEADLGELVRPASGRPPLLVAIDGVTDPGQSGCDPAQLRRGRCHRGVAAPSPDGARHADGHESVRGCRRVRADGARRRPADHDQAAPGQRCLGGRARRRRVDEPVRDRRAGAIPDLCRARCRGRGSRAARARAVRHVGVDPDAWPVELAQRVGGGGAHHLPDRAVAVDPVVTGPAVSAFVHSATMSDVERGAPPPHGTPVPEIEAGSAADQATSIGRRRFIAGAGVTAAALLADRGAGVAAVGVEPGASYFTPVTPTRVCDTRRRFGAIELGGGTRRVRIAGHLGVPSDAVAVVATVTAVGGPIAPNHLRVFPAGTARPEVSAVNIPDTESAIANLVTVKLGTSGSAKGAIDLYSPRFTHVVVDVQGVYRPTSWPVTAGRIVAFDEARRAWDSRGAQRERPLIRAGSSTWVNLSWIVPRDAEAVIANLTFVRPVSRGYLTAYPRPPRPEASNVNGLGGQVRAVAIQTKLHYDPARQQVGFYVYNSVATHILVDVGGYVTGESAPRSSDGLFVPINPIRLLDTRKLTGNQRRLWPGWTRDVQLPSGWRSKAQAVTLNLGAVTAMAPGYFTMLPAGTPRPTVSTLNASVPGMNIANGSITRTSRNGVACFSSSGSHIILDVTGWFTGRPSPGHRVGGQSATATREPAVDAVGAADGCDAPRVRGQPTADREPGRRVALAEHRQRRVPGGIDRTVRPPHRGAGAVAQRRGVPLSGAPAEG